MDNEFDYITQMVEDTFEQVSSDDNVIQFPELNTVAKESEQLSFDFNILKGSLDQMRGCICIDLSGQHIEIPVNWGPFKLYNLKESNVFIQIEKHDDVDLFLDVLASVLGTNIDVVSFYIQDGEVVIKLNETSIQDIAA